MKLAKRQYYFKKYYDYLCCSCLAHKAQAIKENNNIYSHTVHLPKTAFPGRVKAKDRKSLDISIYEKAKFAELYDWQRQNIQGPEFILHDGPPYANGKPHMGHAINKILKDITLRNKLLQGLKVHYIPGWDCHGLPIELKALTNKSSKLLPSEIHSKARAFALKAIDEQKEVFRSWGILTDWESSYFTFEKNYIKNQFQQFFKLYEKGLIYRDVKPVHWSPSSRTALAEAELEYNDKHESTAVFLRLTMHAISSHIPQQSEIDLSLLVWTTTPWTLPMNQAVCYSPNIEYCIASDHQEGHKYIVAADLVGSLKEKLKTELSIESTFPGVSLKGCTYRHPVFPDQILPLLPGKHVSTNKGTGLVHTAPAHGPEDFLVALENGLKVNSFVDDAGCFGSEAGNQLNGLDVLTNGNEKVLQLVEKNIVHWEKYVHSYPYDWRTKKPVIVKASKQWFINTDLIKDKAIKSLENIRVYPDRNSSYLAQMEHRPYWCISRQRVWGVPIPVLINNDTEETFTSRSFINHICSLLDKHGSDFWWMLPVEQLVTPDIQAMSGGSTLSPGKDILDIWLDSGLSWSVVLGEGKQADLYLEGVDQFRGWFYSSLLTSIALQDKPPYKSLFVHGFAVDSHGKKMSKSEGNVVDPQVITTGSQKQSALGVDTLRWWVAAHGTQHSNIPVSDALLNSSFDEVQKIRLSLRFLLGVLNNFPGQLQNLPTEAYVLDQYLLHSLFNLQNQVMKQYNEYSYNQVCKMLVNFISNELSALYFHLTKDRLYCDMVDSPRRLSCLSVMKHLFIGVSHLAAPILPFLVEEAYLYFPKDKNEPFFQSRCWKPQVEWNQSNIENIMKLALQVKQGFIQLEPTSNSQLFHVQINASPSTHQVLQLMQPEHFSEDSQLTELLQVSAVTLIPMESSDKKFEIKRLKTEKSQCLRCRRFSCDTVSSNKLCIRCQKVLKSFSG